MADFNDEPISCPSEDKFGFNPFAKTIAKCIKKLQKPVGSVVAIYGPWGSGKSSAINLIRFHLGKTDPTPKIVPFQCWLYRTEDALTVGFLQELYAGLSPSLSNRSRARKSLRKLGAHVAAAGDLLGVVVGATTGSFWGKFFTSASGVLENYMKNDKSIESLQDDVAEALNNSKQRFLVVVDDIDRLSPDEALVIFRLIKSIGRLPNVAYLLAYDRERTEKAVEERYPSEGSHYLEKIVQAGFELPEPSQAKLIEMLKKGADRIFGKSNNSEPTHMSNVFSEVVLPEIKTPRDVLRLTYALSVTYPAVKDDVDTADFLGIETLRIFRPSVFQAVRSNKSKLLELDQMHYYRSQEQLGNEYENEFLRREPKDHRSRLKFTLMTLFPYLQSVWRGARISEDEKWSQHRRACSAIHFDTYFRFSPSPHTIPLSEIKSLIHRVNEPKYVHSQFHKALGIRHAEGRTKASFLLEEMRYHSSSIPVKHVGSFLSALYSIADDLHVKCDDERGYVGIDNQLRLRRLTCALLLSRTNLSERSPMIRNACQDASLGWLSHISVNAYQDHYPPNPGATPSTPEKFLMTKKDAEHTRKLALQRLRDSATKKELTTIKDLSWVLVRWHQLAGVRSKVVQKFCADTIKCDTGVVTFARAFLSYSYIQDHDELGNLVVSKKDKAEVDIIKSLMNPNLFKKRLTKVAQVTTLDQNDRDVIQRLIDAWEAHDQGKN